MSLMPLTDVKIRQITPPASGQTSYPDGSIPGFSLRVSQGGTKTFVLVHGRARTRTTLGRYPIITLSQARQKAREILASITLGTYQEQRGLTFQDAFDLYRQHKLPQNRESTAKETTRLIQKFVAHYGNTQLAQLHTQTLVRFLDATTELSHVQTALSTMFLWCVRRGYIENSPLARVPKQRAVPRDRTLSTSELSRVLEATSSLGRYGQLIRFLIYTGQRLGQATCLTHNHIGQDQTLHWPSEQMKVPTPGGHTIPYGPLTARLLEEAQIPFTKTERYHTRLVAASGVEWFTRNDCRRTWRTIHAMIGTQPHIGERLMAHAVGNSVQQVYERYSYMAEMRQACNAYEEYLRGLVGSNVAV